MRSGIIRIAATLLLSGLFPAGSSAVRAEAVPLKFDRLACLGKPIDAIRTDLSRLHTALDDCRGEFSRKTNHLFSETETRIAFASAAAHAMAPYGTSSALTLEALLADTVLDCDNYAMLSVYFMKQLVAGDIATKFSGFDGGAVGNHAQLFIRTADSRDLLLDPTIGLVAIADFNGVLQGKPVPGHSLFVFHQHDDATIDAFAAKVRNALLDGNYKPTDILYVFHSFDDVISFADRTASAWKSKDINAIVGNYPSPASIALRKNLEATLKP